MVTLNEDNDDRVRNIALGALGTIPIVGSLVQAVISDIIPDLRTTRIEAFLLSLSERTATLELDCVLRSSAKIDIIEEGLWQAARAFTDERKQQLAILVASGLKEEDTEAYKFKHFLNVLRQIEDIQVLILKAFCDAGYRYNRNHRENTDDPTGINIKDLIELENGLELSTDISIYASMVGALETFGLISNDGSWNSLGGHRYHIPFFVTRFGVDFLSTLEVIQAEN